MSCQNCLCSALPKLTDKQTPRGSIFKTAGVSALVATVVGVGGFLLPYSERGKEMLEERPGRK